MKHYLLCSVCGVRAGRWEQHWNMDTGYGICKSCVQYVQDAKAVREPLTPTEVVETYGKPGVNYEAPDEKTTEPNAGENKSDGKLPAQN